MEEAKADNGRSDGREEHWSSDLLGGFMESGV